MFPNNVVDFVKFFIKEDFKDNLCGPMKRNYEFYYTCITNGYESRRELDNIKLNHAFLWLIRYSFILLYFILILALIATNLRFCIYDFIIGVPIVSVFFSGFIIIINEIMTGAYAFVIIKLKKYIDRYNDFNK